MFKNTLSRNICTFDKYTPKIYFKNTLLEKHIQDMHFKKSTKKLRNFKKKLFENTHTRDPSKKQRVFFCVVFLEYWLIVRLQ